jgi:hypothetical protein
LGLKRDKVRGEWRRLHNEELYDLYASPNIVGVNKSRQMRWAGHVACLRDRRGAYRPEGKRPLERPRYRWEDKEDNVKVDFQDVGFVEHGLD